LEVVVVAQPDRMAAQAMRMIGLLIMRGRLSKSDLICKTTAFGVYRFKPL
jgi:hypothetical protein